MSNEESLEALVQELQDFAGSAIRGASLEPADLRRVLSFTAKVSQVADQAFQDVLAVLIEVKFLTPQDLRSGRLNEVRKQVELLTLRSRYRDAEEICSRLHHLGDQFQSQIAPLLSNVTDLHGWRGLFGLLNEHEGRLIMLVHQTIYELTRQLEMVTQRSLPQVVEYAKARSTIVRQGIDELRELSNKILGLSGEPGLLELTATDRAPRISSVFLNKGSVHMSRDSYSAGQAGAMGPGASAQNMTFQQIWQQNAGTINLEQLGSELARLRSAMRAEASEPEHDLSLGEVAAAEREAKSGNGSGTLEHLKKAGRWALDVATKIGVNVASSAIKASIGMPG